MLRHFLCALSLILMMVSFAAAETPSENNPASRGNGQEGLLRSDTFIQIITQKPSPTPASITPTAGEPGESDEEPLQVITLHDIPIVPASPET